MKIIKSLSSVIAVAATLAFSSSAFAADSSWNVNANGNWTTSGNWTAGVPGSNSTTTNPDTATFGFTLTAVRTVTVDSNRNIGNITLSNTANFGYILSGGSLKLTSGGTILKSAGTNTDTISTPIEIEGDAGTATITNNTAAGLSIGSAITGVSTTGNTTVLTLNGNGTSTNNALNGLITDGGTGKLAIVKDGTGTWSIGQGANVNSYSGGLTLNNGTLNVGKVSSFGTGTLTINGGAISGGTSGAALTVSDTVINGNFTSSLNSAMSLGTGNVSLGSAAGTSRTITMTGANMLTINSVISDGTTAKGLILNLGTTSLITLGGNNTFTGGLTLYQGTLTLGDAKALGTGTFTITGGSGVGISLNTATDLTITNNVVLETVGGFGAGITGGTGNLTMNGSLTQSGLGKAINRTGRTDINGNVYLSANSTSGYTLVLGGTNNGDGSVSGAISNWNGVGGTASTINKIGNGTWTFSGASTYNGTTQVTGGMLIYGTNQAISANSTLNIKTVGASTTATIDFAGYNATVNSVLFGGTSAALGSANLLSTGTGTLTLGSSTTVSYSTASSTNPGTATISGKVDLGTGTRTFSVADSTQTTNELAITAAISSSAGTYGVTKTGAGTMTFSGANTYTGVTSVQDGILLRAPNIESR